MITKLLLLVFGYLNQFVYEDATVYVVERLIPRWAVGVTWRDSIFVLKGWEYDPLNKALLRHEYTHVRQFRRYGVLGMAVRYVWYMLVAMWKARSIDPARWYEYHPLEAEAQRSECGCPN